MQSLLIQDYMSEDYHSVTASMNISSAVDILLANNITGTPVTDQNLNVIGFISEKDCISHIVTSSYYCDEPPTVADIMSTEVVTVAPNSSVLEVAEMMSNSPVKVYPVVEQNRLVGIIKRRDILKALMNNQKNCFIARS